MTHVLDASALLAMIHGEPGAERVLSVSDDAVIGAVNLAEVVGVLASTGLAADRMMAMIGGLQIPVIVQDRNAAAEVGLMRPVTASLGLSLGDRYCLVLGRELNATVLTADRSWMDVSDAVGVTVELIR